MGFNSGFKGLTACIRSTILQSGFVRTRRKLQPSDPAFCNLGLFLDETNCLCNVHSYSISMCSFTVQLHASGIPLFSLVKLRDENNASISDYYVWMNVDNTAFNITSYEAYFNPLNPELNPICYLLALLGAHHFLHVSRIRVKYIYIYIYIYIYGAPILDVSRSHTTTQHIR